MECKHGLEDIYSTSQIIFVDFKLRYIADLKYISDKRFKNNPALKKNLSVMYELIDVLVNFEERKGFEFSVQYRRLLEVIMKDLASGIVENISS